MPEPVPAVIFMHIPKTAGMSLFIALCEHFGPRVAELYNAQHSARDAAARIFRDPRYAAFAGHFSFGVHEWMAQPASYFAVLRDPLHRVVSLYYFLGEMRQVILAWCTARGKSVAEAIAEQQVFEFLADFTPWLEGEDTLEVFLDCPVADLDNTLVRRFSGLGPAPGPCPASALAQARANIEASYSVVGLVEQYAQTLALLRATFDWPWLRERRVNRTRSRRPVDEMSAQLRRRIERMNELDRALYAWAAERFARQLAAPPPPIVLPGGGRTDPATLPMDRAIGQPHQLQVVRYLYGEEPAEPELGGPFVMPPIA